MSKKKRYLRLAPRHREEKKGHWWVETGGGGCGGLSRKSGWEKTPEDGL